MKPRISRIFVPGLLAGMLFVTSAGVARAQAAKDGEQVLVTGGEIGRSGGRLIASLRADPKTLNPVTAVDLPSKEVIALLFADLIHIDLFTQGTEPALAK